VSLPPSVAPATGHADKRRTAAEHAGRTPASPCLSALLQRIPLWPSSCLLLQVLPCLPSLLPSPSFPLVRHSVLAVSTVLFLSPSGSVVTSSCVCAIYCHGDLRRGTASGAGRQNEKQKKKEGEFKKGKRRKEKERERKKRRKEWKREEGGTRNKETLERKRGKKGRRNRTTTPPQGWGGAKRKEKREAESPPLRTKKGGAGAGGSCVLGVRGGVGEISLTPPCVHIWRRVAVSRPGVLPPSTLHYHRSGSARSA